jgi:tRNA-specific 2-thiouridylase
MKIVVGLSEGRFRRGRAAVKREGHDVVGLFMKNWEDDDSDEYCSPRGPDRRGVRGRENRHRRPAVNFAAEYRERVFASFLAEYKAGRTPIPTCSATPRSSSRHSSTTRWRWAERIATGHYARLEQRDGRFVLLKGLDPGKDQSYFLHRLNQAQLARTLFPVGHLRKTEVRAIAREAGLPNHAKRDSTGICFIGERPFREFLSRYLPREPGPMVTPGGERVGEHQGLMYYTIGQRQGLGIGGRRDGAGEPWYVAGKDPGSNTLTVVQGHDHALLLRNNLSAADASWIAGAPPGVEEGELGAKTRYRQSDSACGLRRKARSVLRPISPLPSGR